MNIKVAAFTVSEKSSNTLCHKHALVEEKEMFNTVNLHQFIKMIIGRKKSPFFCRLRNAIGFIIRAT